MCASITEFIEKKLLLKVNRDKTKVCHIANSELKFLGYGFYYDRAKHRILPRLHRKTRAKFKNLQVVKRSLKAQKRSRHFS